MTDQVFGIDLGTTYSAVALVNDLGVPEIIKNFEGADTTPSVVYFEDDGSVTVGSQAKQTQITDPENAVSLIKRHMGEVFPLELRGKPLTPESVSALILKELVNAANRQHGLDVTKAVITVPAYFGIQERQATRNAGEMAGLDVVGIIPEPVAAAISLGTGQEEQNTLLVFDLGGGTFDTTILRARKGAVDVVAIDGNRLLGGADWDMRLEDLFLTKFAQETGADEDELRVDEDFMIGLREIVEEAKKTLTLRPQVKRLVQFEGKKASVEVSREEFEAATRDLVDETLTITRRVIATAQAKEPGLEIDRLLLVGGSSRMPMISAALQAAGMAPEDTDFDLSVAKGAAVYGYDDQSWTTSGADGEGQGSLPEGQPSGPNGVARSGSITVSNVLSRGLGVGMMARNADGQMEEIVEFLAHANESLPLVAETSGGILRDGQTAVEVPLYEQSGEVESQHREDNKQMAAGESTTISGLTGMHEGDAILVHLTVSEEGTASLSATEPKSGRTFTATVAVQVLSEEEVRAATEMVAGIQTLS